MKKPHKANKTKKRKEKFVKRTKSTPTVDIDWAVRYGNIDNYKRLCARTHAATGGRCCVCLKAKSEVIHHSRYLGDRDEPGVNVFSTCVSCHRKSCHSSKNWVRHKKDPLWRNRNTHEFEKRLQEGFKLLSKGRTVTITPV